MVSLSMQAAVCVAHSVRRMAVAFGSPDAIEVARERAKLAQLLARAGEAAAAREQARLALPILAGFALPVDADDIGGLQFLVR